MSYSTINLCAADYSLIGRVTAAVAQEQLAGGMAADPAANINAMMWAVSSASDIEAAYASALAANNPDPGGDESVVTDGMILAAVQANLGGGGGGVGSGV